VNEFIPRYGVSDIRLIESRGPWDTKSGGKLNVLFALSRAELDAFLDAENPEFDIVQSSSGYDIRGLRSYSVSEIPNGSIGANEWHRARTECVIALSGRALWHCVDLAGDERNFTLDGSNAVITPPGILHTYTALEDDTRLQVICNTLFIPDEPSTHDTYPKDTFEELRANGSLS
jgi:hypothetical protein